MSPGDGLRVEIIRSFSEQALRDILTAYRRGMPWDFHDADEYLREMLLNGECVHVLLRKGDIPAGYLLAKPHVAAASDPELREADPEFPADPERYYIETMAIVPEVRNTLAGGKMFYRMLHTLFDEVKSRFGINKYSMHVRVGNGASDAVQRYFAEMITASRRIDKWRFYNGEDAADYLEGTYTGDRGKVAPMKRERKKWADEDIYTPLEEAKEEIWRRWKDEILRQKVIEYVKKVPEPLIEEPSAIYDRTIITPNRELQYFKGMSKYSNLSNLCFEFLADKFCSLNLDKLRLAKMPFSRGRNKKGLEMIEYKTIIDCAVNDGKACRSIETLWNDNFVKFHHLLLSKAFTDIKIYDMSIWFQSHGGKAKEYYRYFLALFICHGILFDNFLTTGEEERFTNTVVLPAYEEVVKRFGMKPLIVQLLPPETAGDDYWRSYPIELMEEVEKCLARKSRQTQCT